MTTLNAGFSLGEHRVESVVDAANHEEERKVLEYDVEGRTVDVVGDDAEEDLFGRVDNSRNSANCLRLRLNS